MNIEAQLELELSRWNTDLVAAYIGRDPLRFRELWNQIFPEKYPASPRAAWVAEFCCIRYPDLLKPYLKELLSNLAEIRNDGIKRHMVKILTYQSIPEEYLGNLIDLCFTWLQVNELPVAVKVHCMQIIYNTIPHFPELKEEFIAVVEDQIPKNSAGFSSRAKRLFEGLKDFA